ncbi:MAG: sigma-70 family RNA polymerase sigma factor [Clostridia bacterium]|nr:sigma-70 family RNA polymerase sigma factor [Clostridia bacterium]
MNDPASAEELIVNNLPLARALARRFSNGGGEPEDLFQIACLGLVKAARRFDPGRGAAFSTYAFIIMEGELRRALRDTAASGPGRRYARLAARASALAEKERVSGRDLRVSELAELLSCPREELELALAISAPAVPMGGGGEPSFPQPAGEGFEEQAIDRLTAQKLVSSLPEREAELIRLRYFNDLPQKTAAKLLGLSQPAASRAEKRALKLMRAAFGHGEKPSAAGETKIYFDLL